MHLVSLPSRERGLKFFSVAFLEFSKWSLPSRERGLKFVCTFFTISPSASLPSRERGLKFMVDEEKKGLIEVAPLAGAWIEM